MTIDSQPSDEELASTAAALGRLAEFIASLPEAERDAVRRVARWEASNSESDDDVSGFAAPGRVLLTGLSPVQDDIMSMCFIMMAEQAKSAREDAEAFRYSQKKGRHRFP